MAEKKKPSKTKEKQTTTQQAQPSQKQAGFRVLSQYITDLSFECPQPPALLGQFSNNMNLEVGVHSKPAEGVKDAPKGTEVFEVTISVRAHNKTEKGTTIYLFELKYSGLFMLENIPTEHRGGLLGVEAPTLLYPFARQIFATTASASGLQTPLLEPVNFAAIYMQQQQQNQQKTAVN